MTSLKRKIIHQGLLFIDVYPELAQVFMRSPACGRDLCPISASRQTGEKNKNRMIKYMNLVKIVFFLFLTPALTSCFLIREASSNIVYGNSKSKKNYLAINTFTNSRCGCTDIYAQKFDNGKLTYAFYYGCTSFAKPEKVVNIYDDKMKLTSTDRFELVESTDYDTAFDSLDLFVLQKMDSFRLNQKVYLEEYKMCKRQYQGLRRLTFK